MTDIILSTYELGAPADTAPWEDLRLAVVAQAAEDYEAARRTLRRFPDDPAAAKRMKEVASFFRSERFDALTGLNGEAFLKRLEKHITDQFKEEYHRAYISDRRSRASHVRAGIAGGCPRAGAGRV